jgi:murein DD-endopeptidase MepM/ murein hydrolase activator NlpD
MTRRARTPGPWLSRLLLPAAAVLLGLELPYVNWRAAVPPVDARPLLIRRDARGDGRFLSPRSGNRRHRGVDLAAGLGTPVRAIRSGRVAEVGNHRGLGRFVALEHGGGLRTLYAHLETSAVEPGGRVAQGAIIGTVGKTGNARHQWITPHLHLEVTRGGALLDPASLGLRLVERNSSVAESGGTDARGGG